MINYLKLYSHPAPVQGDFEKMAMHLLDQELQQLSPRPYES